MKSLKTVLEFRSSENTHTPRFGLNLFDYLWRVVGIQSHSHTLSLPTIFWKGKLETVFLTIKRHEIHLFLSLFAHMYACIGQKYSVSKLLLSLLVCMYWPSRTSTPSQKGNILSNCLLVNQQRENISLWEGVLVLEGQYIHTSRESNSFETEYFWLIPTHQHTLPKWNILSDQINSIAFSLAHTNRENTIHMYLRYTLVYN